ncbi:unnamed protein product [Pedinophyceae sp. YPF-701]|nr:unnamed protein product [Pedinophyceae sp. YPF-701]
MVAEDTTTMSAPTHAVPPRSRERAKTPLSLNLPHSGTAGGTTGQYAGVTHPPGNAAAIAGPHGTEPLLSARAPAPPLPLQTEGDMRAPPAVAASGAHMSFLRMLGLLGSNSGAASHGAGSARVAPTSQPELPAAPPARSHQRTPPLQPAAPQPSQDAHSKLVSALGTLISNAYLAARGTQPGHGQRGNHARRSGGGGNGSVGALSHGCGGASSRPPLDVAGGTHKHKHHHHRAANNNPYYAKPQPAPEHQPSTPASKEMPRPPPPPPAKARSHKADDLPQHQQAQPPAQKQQGEKRSARSQEPAHGKPASPSAAQQPAAKKQKLMPGPSTQQQTDAQNALAMLADWITQQAPQRQDVGAQPGAGELAGQIMSTLLSSAQQVQRTGAHVAHRDSEQLSDKSGGGGAEGSGGGAEGGNGSGEEAAGRPDAVMRGGERQSGNAGGSGVDGDDSGGVDGEGSNEPGKKRSTENPCSGSGLLGLSSGESRGVQEGNGNAVAATINGSGATADGVGGVVGSALRTQELQAATAAPDKDRSGANLLGRLDLAINGSSAIDGRFAGQPNNGADASGCFPGGFSAVRKGGAAAPTAEGGGSGSGSGEVARGAGRGGTPGSVPLLGPALAAKPAGAPVAGVVDPATGLNGSSKEGSNNGGTNGNGGSGHNGNGSSKEGSAGNGNGSGGNGNGSGGTGNNGWGKAGSNRGSGNGADGSGSDGNGTGGPASPAQPRPSPLPPPSS